MHKLPLLLLAALLCTSLAAQDDYERWRDSVEESWRGYEQQMDDAYLSYKRHIERIWAEFVDSTPSTWVEYGPQKSVRSAVDFEQGTLELATVLPADTPNPQQAAQERLRLQLTRVVREADDTGTPLLQDQLCAPDGNLVTPDNVEQEAQALVQAPEARNITTPEGPKLLYTVRLELVPDHLQERAGRYLPDILAFCQRFEIPAPLAMGVIHTESHFNPRAINRSTGACGLMQIIPRYAGVTMNRILHDDPRQPTTEELYDPRRNLEMGIGYLHYLDIHYFADIRSMRSRYYAIIAAYNGGAGNVYRTFSGQNRHSDEFDKIVNDLKDEDVFLRLTGSHPYGETRRYLIKVTSRAEDYGGL